MTAAYCAYMLDREPTGEEASRAWDAVSKPLLDSLNDPYLPFMMSQCLDPLASYVNQNHDLSLALSSTHAYEVVIKYLKAHPLDRDVQLKYLPWLAVAASSACPECAAVMDNLGGFECFSAALRNFPDDAGLEAAAWAGLSDLSHGAQGAAAVINQEGPFKGVDLIMQRLRAHPEPHWGEMSTHLTVKYGIMRSIDGILRHDDGSRAYTSHFLQAGLVEQVLRSMAAEADLRATQHVGCEVMRRLLDCDASVSVSLIDGGAVELLRSAMHRFHDDDRTPSVGGLCKAPGPCFTVFPLCSKVLLALGLAHQSIAVAAGVDERNRAHREASRSVATAITDMQK